MKYEIVDALGSEFGSCALIPIDAPLDSLPRLMSEPSQGAKAGIKMLIRELFAAVLRSLRVSVHGLTVAASIVAFGALLIGAPDASSMTVFSDDFDSEVGNGEGASGGSGLSYASFTNWTISDGTVDLLGHGDFAPGTGVVCAGLSGKCVDLDGGSNDAGVMTSISILLNPGTYDFSYELSGVDADFGQAGATPPNIVDVAIGTHYVAQHTLNKGDPYASFGGQFSILAATSVEIVFANQGGDNFGAVLDNVSLTAVPEPGTFSLIFVGLGILSLGRPQRSSS